MLQEGLEHDHFKVNLWVIKQQPDTWKVFLEPMTIVLKKTIALAVNLADRR